MTKRKRERAEAERHPHACTECDKTFKRSYDLAIHKRTHTGERPYKCDVPGCEAAFAQSSHLTTHKRTHTGSRPHKCDVPGCEATFARSHHLARHSLTHTGEKPFKCDFPECKAAFAETGDIVKHKRTHTGERPYKCDYLGCDVAVAQSSTLLVHRRTHTGEKPYLCHFPGCGRRFTRSTTRNTHEKFFHDEQRKEQYVKKKEEWTVATLKKAGIAHDREIHVTFKCGTDTGTFARLDFVIYKEDHIVILSVDEFQHQDYSVLCEVARMSKVVCSIRAAGDERRIVWLRLNPDTFRINGECVRVSIKERAEVMLRCISQSAELLGERQLALYYLYYDCCSRADGTTIQKLPDVAKDPEYSKQWRECIAGCIVK